MVGRFDDITGAEWTTMRELLEDFSRARATQGFSASETAVFVFSLKQPLFDMLPRELGADAEQIGRQTWNVTRLRRWARQPASASARSMASSGSRTDMSRSNRNLASARRFACICLAAIR